MQTQQKTEETCKTDMNLKRRRSGLQTERSRRSTQGLSAVSTKGILRQGQEAQVMRHRRQRLGKSTYTHIADLISGEVKRG